MQHQDNNPDSKVVLFSSNLEEINKFLKQLLQNKNFELPSYSRGENFAYLKYTDKYDLTYIFVCLNEKIDFNYLPYFLEGATSYIVIDEKNINPDNLNLFGTICREKQIEKITPENHFPHDIFTLIDEKSVNSSKQPHEVHFTDEEFMIESDAQNAEEMLSHALDNLNEEEKETYFLSVKAALEKTFPHDPHKVFYILREHFPHKTDELEEEVYQLNEWTLLIPPGEKKPLSNQPLELKPQDIQKKPAQNKALQLAPGDSPPKLEKEETKASPKFFDSAKKQMSVKFKEALASVQTLINRKEDGKEKETDKKSKNLPKSRGGTNKSI